MASKEYSLIREEEAIDEVSTQHHNNHLRFGERRQFGSGTVSLTLAISLATNIVLVVLQLLHGRHEVSSTRTAFGKCIFSYASYRSIDHQTAGLERNKRIAWTDDSDFASHNRTTWDQAWETLKPDTGFVAISDDLAIRTGLHESQRWPWDPSKGLYLLQGYHSLHCLVSYLILLGGNGGFQLTPPPLWYRPYCGQRSRKCTTTNRKACTSST